MGFDCINHCLSIYFGIVISTFLYACDSWILTAELEKRTQAFKTKCYQRLNNSAYKVNITNEEVRRKIQVSQGRKKSWLERDSNPGPLAYLRALSQLSYRATWSSFDVLPPA